MATIRVHQEFKSRKLRRDPSDKTYVAKQDFVDAKGVKYPTGTKFVAISGGYDNPARSMYSDLVIV